LNSSASGITSASSRYRVGPDGSFPQSDIDILVEFELESKVSLFDIAGMELELAETFGARLTFELLSTLAGISVNEVVATAAVQYERP
jgi:predicted nucleotidyltransferase